MRAMYKGSEDINTIKDMQLIINLINSLNISDVGKSLIIPIDIAINKHISSIFEWKDQSEDTYSNILRFFTDVLGMTIDLTIRDNHIELRINEEDSLFHILK